MTDTVDRVDIEEIMDLIPHRYPFLLVDRVEEIVPMTSAKGLKLVSMNEPHLQGHFPGKPVMPGVLVVEAMAQTASILVAQSVGLKGKGALVYFMSIDKCRFRKKVVPGDVLELHLEVLRPGGKVWKLKGVAKVDGQTAAEAEIMAMIEIPKPEPVSA
ncbi:MAG: 3-hydroxyacyl-ACP dehydratase FabZ [Pseudomonadota bacterium]